MNPEILSTRKIYGGRVFDVVEERIREGEIDYTREVVVHKGSAVIIPVFGDGSILLVRQYRHAAGKYLLELCAGTLESGEDPAAAAARELEEELGLKAAKLEKLIEFYVSPGFLTEKMHLFYASDLTETAQRLDADEIISVERLELSKALDLVRTGQIEDAKTIIGIELAAAKVGR